MFASEDSPRASRALVIVSNEKSTSSEVALNTSPNELAIQLLGIFKVFGLEDLWRKLKIEILTIVFSPYFQLPLFERSVVANHLNIISKQQFWEANLHNDNQ